MEELAILMASGLGKRMQPLTLTRPKPLIEVSNLPMIETVIQGLLANRKIDDICIVVGYLRTQFEYLNKKYSKIKIIENPDYENVNNISSIYYAREVLRKGCDCFICEADLYLRSPEILSSELTESCYFGKMLNGHSDDWTFDVDDDGYISRISKEGDDCYNMVGFSYFKASDAAILADCIESAYRKAGYEEMFWDDVVNHNLDKLKLRIHQVKPEDIIEIDTVEELRNAQMRYKD